MNRVSLPKPSRYAAEIVTIVTASDPINKTFKRSQSGINKTAGIVGSGAVAVAHTAETPEMLASMIRSISENHCQALILGRIRGAEIGSGVYLQTEEDYRALIGRPPKKEDPDKSPLPPIWTSGDGRQFAARLKASMEPSSWVLLDRDDVVGMPAHLQSMTRDQWHSSIASILPGYDKAGKIVVTSSSARLIVDGQQQSSGNFHVYVQIQDPDDLNRLGVALHLRAHQDGLGFRRPIFSRSTGEEIYQRPWAIFDPTTFSQERLSYEGSPVVRGKGLALAPAEVEVIDGPPLDSSLVAMPTSPVNGLSAERRKDGSWITVADGGFLDPEAVIETEVGGMTVQAYAVSSHGKLRCQAFNRPDSTSWNGYLNRHKDGTPFFFDNGTRTKFLYRPSFAELAERLEAFSADTCSEDIAAVIRCAAVLCPLERDRLFKHIKSQTGLTLGAIREAAKQESTNDGTGSRRDDHVGLARQFVAHVGTGNFIVTQEGIFTWKV